MQPMSRKRNSGASHAARQSRTREMNARTIVECLLTPLCLPGMDETMFVATQGTRQVSRLLLAHVLEVDKKVETGALSDTPFRVDRDAVRVARQALERFLDNSAEFVNIMAIRKSGINTPRAAFSSMFFQASPDVGMIQTLCDRHASRLAAERLRHIEAMLKTSMVGCEVYQVRRVATHASTTKKKHSRTWSSMFIHSVEWHVLKVAAGKRRVVVRRPHRPRCRLHAAEQFSGHPLDPQFLIRRKHQPQHRAEGLRQRQ